MEINKQKSSSEARRGQKFSLTPSDVCSIIRECGESGVAELKLGDLHVVFGPKPDPRVEVAQVTHPTTEIAAIQEKIGKRALEQDEIALREAQLAAAIIEDPALAEELFIQGELESDDGPEDFEEA